MPVGGEDDLLRSGEAVDDLLRIAGGADDVTQRLHARRAIDVADDLVVRILLEPLAELIRWTAIGQRAPRVEIGEQHLLVGVEDLRRLGHEMDAAEGDDFRLRPGRLLRELQGVADEVRQILDVGVLVVMSEDHRIELFAQPLDLAQQLISLGQRRAHGDILTS